MRVFSVLLTTALAVVLLSPITVHAKQKTNREDEVEERAEKKISTSLKITDDASRNRTDNKKLAMVTLVSTQTTSNDTTTPTVSSLIDTEHPENVTRELILPSSVNIARIFSEESAGDEETPEELPEAQELKIVRTGARRRPLYRPPPRRPTSLNRRNVYAEPPRTSLGRPPRRPTETKRGPTENECTFFSKTVCLEAFDYPHEAITRSLRNNKEMVAALLTDYKSQEYGSAEESSPMALPLENKYTNNYEHRYENRYEINEIKRRIDVSSLDNVEEGFTCPSVVKYARPQLARAASGVWKYIINTGEHTQTLRLEKCSSPQTSCSFISENYRSSCVQVYNYHRLLTWDSKLGLHMDIFKVPSCCSCHVHGYAEIFPPHQRDPPQKQKESFPGADFATMNEQKDDLHDLVKPTYLNKFNTNFDSSLVSSNKKPVIDSSPSRPPFSLAPPRMRPKKPTPMPRPFDKLPQQHAPNTRAPGYTGPLTKAPRPIRPSRPPFRRESSAQLEEQAETVTNTSIRNQYSQPYDQEMDATSRLQNSGFDEEYQEPQRRINYNYHPIIDFFKPEASMLQSDSSLSSQSSIQADSNSWKPVISS